MKIQLLDCTIRDGGYLTGKNFKPEFVNGVIEGLIKANIDYIELGFLQNSVNGESIVYKDSLTAQRWIPSFRGISQFTGFADNSRYSINNLDTCDGNSFENLRICFAKHEYKEAMAFAKAAKGKGYGVFVQPMDALGYTMDERLDLLAAVNDIRPSCVSIVDTFGAMFLEDLRSIFKLFDKSLDKSIKIGCHSHNNLQLSCALAQEFIGLAVQSDRDIVVDTSLLGMGRGAGNAATEVLANFLNKNYGKCYDLSVIFSTIDKHVAPLKNSLGWGYNLPMFICGCQNSHVDNAYYLQKNTQLGSSDMYNIIGSMDIEKRKRYDFQYSKSDFSELEKAYESYTVKRQGE